MKLRLAEEKDWEDVVRICKNHYIPFPEFRYIMSLPVVVDENDKVVALGYIRQFVEVTFIPDLVDRPRVIVKALKMLQAFVESEMIRLNIDRIFGFVTDPRFKEILLKHFNYKVCNGTALFYKKDH